MQIPILRGTYTDNDTNFRKRFPINLKPVPKQHGISNGYLRPGDGVEEIAQGPGIDRGGINWRDECYRVMGERLVKIDINGNVTDYGEIVGQTQCTLDYGFTYLGITTDKDFYLFDGTTITQVTDPDLGNVFDHIWIDGYFMLTDGENLIVTELNDPFSVNPLNYGSSEVDPDPILALLKVRNEAYALNRYTIEVFDNIGGTGFPFQRIEGAQIQRGTIGTHTCALFLQSIAFMGGGRNEAIAVWFGQSGSTVKLSTREIDQILASYEDTTLATAIMDTRVDEGHQYIYIHLPDQTLVYDGAATQALGQPIWFVLSTGNTITTNEGLKTEQYRARNLVWCYNEWLVADPQEPRIGMFIDNLSVHWGLRVGWEFNTPIIYNESQGAIIHELELACLSGRGPMDGQPG